MGFHLTLGRDIQKPVAQAPLEMLTHPRVGLNLRMAGTNLGLGLGATGTPTSAHHTHVRSLCR
jgi:hypothetical protein